MKSFEVEQKYRVTKPSSFRKTLRALKAKKIFSDHEFNELYDIRKKFGVKGVLRLRKYAGGKGLLTFKGPRMPGKFKKRVEIETPMDFDKTRAIFKMLGLKVVARYAKWREEYSLGGCHVTLDYLKGAGWFAEIEGPHRKIEALAPRLGFSNKDREERTYLEILNLSLSS